MTRVWVDANVLLRFLTGEPKPQAERARRLVDRVERGEFILKIHVLVLAEMVWVLKSFYKYPMSDVARVLLPLLSSPGTEVDDLELVIRALELARDQNVDFADSYLALRASERGEKVATFDQHDFRRLPADWVLPG